MQVEGWSRAFSSFSFGLSGISENLIIVYLKRQEKEGDAGPGVSRENKILPAAVSFR